MHTHGYHSHCHHDLKYCEHCDVVYCEKCGREWGERINVTYTYRDPYTWTYRGIPYTVTWGSSGNYSLTTSNGTAVKDEKIVNAFYASSNLNNHTTVHTHKAK